jgi:nucleotide-binding universal stress UspA family protein
MNILWATDGSSASQAALPYLKGPLNRRGNRISVVTAVPSPVFTEARPDPAMLLWNLVPDYRERVSAAATDLVVREVEALTPSRADVTSEILLGSPPVALLNHLNDAPPDLLVMGAHGHSGVRDFLVGSVTQQVALNAPCTTLVVRGKRRPRHVLLAYDGSADAEAAIDLLATLPAAGMSVTILNVMEPTPIPPDAVESSATVESLREYARTSARALCAAAVLRLRKAGWSTSTRTRDGRRSDEILRAAAEVGADLIALGARGVHTPSFSGHRTSGVTREVLNHAATAILIGRAP